MKYAILVASFIAVAVLSSTPTLAATTMRCSHQLPPSHTVAKLIDRWAAEVEELSDGAIDVQIFGANSLVHAKQNIVAVARGDIECAFSVQFQWGKTLPIMSVTMTPYAFADMSIWRNWAGSDAAHFLEQKMLAKGLKNVVWLFQTNTSVFTSNGHFLIQPEDFQGVKIRGLAPAFNASLKALGASPVSMAGGEVYQALATGVIDAGMTGVQAAIARHYYEVQDHFAAVPVVSVYFNGYVNPAWYNQLSAQSKAALRKAGKKAAQWAVEAAIENRSSAIAELRAKGVKVHVLTEAENAALERIMRPAFEKALQDIGVDTAARKKLLRLVDQLRSQE